MEEILQEGNKWFVVRYHAGCVGTDMAEKVQAVDGDAATEGLIDQAWEWFWNFNVADEPEDGNEDCDDSVNGMAPELDIWAEEYDPKKHDGLFH